MSEKKRKTGWNWSHGQLCAERLRYQPKAFIPEVKSKHGLRKLTKKETNTSGGTNFPFAGSKEAIKQKMGEVQPMVQAATRRRSRLSPKPSEFKFQGNHKKKFFHLHESVFCCWKVRKSFSSSHCVFVSSVPAECLTLAHGEDLDQVAMLSNLIKIQKIWLTMENWWVLRWHVKEKQTE